MPRASVHGTPSVLFEARDANIPSLKRGAAPDSLRVCHAAFRQGRVEVPSGGPFW